VAAAGLAAGVVWYFGDPAFSNFSCTNPVMAGMGKVAATLHVCKGTQKGLCMDETTWNMCPDKIPVVWPLTHEPVKTVRLFKPESWQDQSAWQQLKAFLTNTDSKVLVATPVSCNETYDALAWQQTLQLLSFLGRDRVMALAVGNEIELLPTKPDTPAECSSSLLQHAENNWRRCVLDLSILGGFADLPMTTVMTTAVLGSEGNTWTPQSMKILDGNLPGSLDIQGLFRVLFSTIPAERFVFTFNIYPYFVPCPPQVGVPCDDYKRNAVCFDDASSCTTPRAAAGARYALRKFAQRFAGDAAPPLRLWIGEVGWSSPKAASLDAGICSKWGTTPCSGWSNLEMLATYYSAFLNWDLNIGDGLEPPEHAFYFTIRDSFNFHSAEHFGLCGSAPQSEADLSLACGNSTAKFTPSVAGRKQRMNSSAGLS